MNAIRQIATSHNGSTIALAEFEKKVQIFDIQSLQIISEFDTILDFGGRRLAISEDGKICICGCWERHGICAYETRTGKIIWQRKDLKKVQHIRMLFTNQDKIFTQFESGTSRVIDIKTGDDISTMAGIKDFFQSSLAPIDVIEKSTKIQIVDRLSGKTNANITIKTFAILDLESAENSFIISESGGPLSCYEIQTGQLNWRIPPNEDGHFLRLKYNQELDIFLGISWPLMTNKFQKIKYINKDNGIIENEIAIGGPATTDFALKGAIVVTSDREIINIKSGQKTSWA